MRTTDILIITFILIWIIILVIFGVLAFVNQKNINKVKDVKENYKVNLVTLSEVELDFKLPEGEVCYLHLQDISAKFTQSKKILIDPADKFYVKNTLQILKTKKQIINLYLTNKNIVIVAPNNNYKLSIDSGTLVKLGIKYINNNFKYELIIKLDKKSYFIIETINDEAYQIYKNITNK